METKVISACVDNTSYYATYYSSDAGTKAIVFYPRIPDAAIDALVQAATKEYLHNPARAIRSPCHDGCVYLETSAAAVSV